MIQKILEAPAPLLRKPFGAILLAILLLVVGIVFFVSAGFDKSFLIISLLLTGYCLYRSASLFWHISADAYTVLEGISSVVGHDKLTKTLIVAVQEESGRVVTMRLRKVSIISGSLYRFYFIGERAEDQPYNQGRLWAVEEIE